MNKDTKMIIKLLAFVIAVLFAILMLFALPGCGDPMTQGVLIGLGTSTATQEASDMAQESKTALVAKILMLQQELEAAATPEQQQALQAELDAAKKKQELVELTASITDKINEGINRDWGDKPASPDNLAWILGAAGTILGGGYGTKKHLDDKKKAAAIARVKIDAKPETEQKVYKAINGA